MKKKHYITPSTSIYSLELEDSFLVTTSKEATIKKETKVVVEEYTEITNEISFD